MAGEAGELAFVATLQDQASAGAKQLKKTMNQVGGATKPITTDVVVDSSKVKSAVGDVEAAEQKIEASLKQAGAQGGEKLTEEVKQAGKRAEQVLSQAGVEAGDKFSEGLRKGTEGAKEAVSGVVDGLGAGVGGAAGAGALVGGAFMLELNKAMDVGAAQDKLSASLGLTGPVAEKAGQVAGEVFSEAYGDSMEQVNDAIKLVSQNITAVGKTSKKDLKGVTESVLNVSTAFDQDLGKTTKAVGQLMRTGLAKNATEALDIITKGLQGPANNADDLLDTFSEYPTQLRKLGLSGQQALGLISQGLKAGARDSDIVADALKEFSIRSIDGSKLTGQSFKALGLDAKKMQEQIAKGGKPAEQGLQLVLDKLKLVKDPADKAAIATGLFGTQAEDLGAALFALDPKSAVASIGAVGGAAEEMGNTLNDNAKSRVVQFGRTLQTEIVDVLGNKVIPKLEEFSGFVKTNVAPSLSDLKDKVLPGVRTQLQELNTWWSKNKDEVKLLSDNIGTLAEGILTKLKPAADAALPVVKELASADLTNLSNSIGAVNRLLAGPPKGTPSGIKAWLQDAGTVTAQVNLPQKIAQVASDSIIQFGDKFIHDTTTRGKVAAWIQKVGPYAAAANPGSALVALGNKLGLNLADGIVGSSPTVKGRVMNLLKNVGAWASLASPGTAVLTIGRRLGLNIGEGLFGSSGTVRGRVSTFMKNIAGWAASAMPGGALLNIGKAAGIDVIQGVGNGMKQAWVNVKAYFSTLPSRLTGGNWGTVLLGAGRAVIEGLISGIRSKIPSVQSILSSVTSSLPSWKGPAAVDRKILYPSGRLVLQGFVDGLKGGVPGIQAYLGKVTANIGKVWANRIAYWQGQANKAAAGSNLRKARQAYVDKLKAQSKTLTAAIAKESKALLAQAAAHDKIAAKLNAAKAQLATLTTARNDYAKSIRDAAVATGDVTKFQQVNDAPITAGFLIKSLKDRVKAINDYYYNLKKLRAMKVDKDIIAQIEAAGVEGGGATAAALANASKAQVAQLNGLESQLRTQASVTGNAAADAMYKSGIAAAQGVVAGIQSQLNKVDAAGVALAKALDAAIRRQLGIHSPSRVMADAGGQVGAGMAVGVLQSISQAEAAARTLAARVAAAAAPSAAQLAQLSSGAAPMSPVIVTRTSDTIVIRHEVAFHGQSPAGVTAGQVADLIARDPKSAAKIEQALRARRATKSSNTIQSSR